MVTHVSSGLGHVAFINNKQLFGMGNNMFGQLGQCSVEHKYVSAPERIKNFDNVTAISCGNYHTAFIQNSHVYVFGINASGELGSGCIRDTENVPQKINEFSNIVGVACGSHHTTIVDSTGLLYTFGDNSYNQLGYMLSDNENQLTPRQVTNIPRVGLFLKYWYPMELIKNQLYIDENKERHSIVIVAILLMAQCDVFKATIDDMLCDVLSFAIDY